MRKGNENTHLREKNWHKTDSTAKEKEVTTNKLCSQGKGKILALLKSVRCLPENCRQLVLSRIFN